MLSSTADRFKGLAILALTGVSLFAQQAATLTGSVHDGSEAAVHEASVRVTNRQTGESYSGVTAVNGSYTIPLVKPGDYELLVGAPGFKQYRRTGITLETGATARVDVQLEIGAVADSVTVEADAPLLNTDTSSVGSVVRNSTIANMPLVGRRAAQLVRLNGFVVQNGSGSTFAIAGGRGDNAMWTIDGGNAQNILLGVATLNFDPPVESLEEFNVEVANFKAELGRTGGGYVQMTTRSGTNNFHGSAYEFLRNDALDARNFFSAGKPSLRYNQFGASIGGPIRKDKTFFFFNYEGIRNNSQSTILANVPTAAEIKGDFSANSTIVRDPLTNAPFPGNVIPADRLDPVGSAIAALYPAPNVDGARSRNNNFRANQSITNPTNVYVTRIDHTFSDRDRVYGRLLASTGNTVNAPVYQVAGVDPYNSSTNNSYYSATATWQHSFSPTTILESRYSYDRRKFINESGGSDLGLAQRFGITGTNERFFPQFTLTGLTGFGNGTHERLQTPIRGDHVSANITTISGKHTWKYGGEFRRSANDDVWNGQAGGVFGFNSTATGDSLAALLLGWTNSGSRAEAPLVGSRARTFGAFLQDDWKVSPRLTLNLGIRWDLDWPRFEAYDNRQNSFDQAAINPVSGTPGVITWSGRNGLSRYAHNFDTNNFGPRVGFAFRATDKWIIRGGGGTLFIGQYDQATPIVANIGFGSRGDFVSTDGGKTAAFLLKDGLPAIAALTEASLVPSFGAVPVGQTPKLAVEFFEPGARAVPYLNTFNFNVQRQLPFDTVFEIAYLASLGHKLGAPTSRSINQVPEDLIGTNSNAQLLRPFPQFSDVRVISPTIGNSNYHGLNLRLDKRNSHGLQFGINYTWSKAIDDVRARNEIGGNAGDNAFGNQYDRAADRGLSGNNIAHRLVGNVTWEIPVGPGRAFSLGNRVLNRALGGWSTSLIYEARSGSPFGIIENNSAAIYPTAATVRSDVVAPYRENANWRSNVLGESFFDTSSFAAPQQYTFGNSGRTVASGPGAIVADVSVLKNFRVSESQRLQFRVEALNFINHANFALPNQQRGNSNFGKISSLVAGNQARIVQLGLHYKF
jgi:hypothetical protein